MASLNLPVINVAAPEYRPCYAQGRPALFHRWCDNARPVRRKYAQEDDTQHYQLHNVQALVEFADGTVARVWPQDIQFIDTRPEFDEYAWPEEVPFYFQSETKEGAGHGDH